MTLLLRSYCKLFMLLSVGLSSGSFTYREIIYGLDELMAGELVEFEEGTIGIALNFGFGLLLHWVCLLGLRLVVWLVIVRGLWLTCRC